MRDNGRTRGVMRRTPKRHCTTSLGHVAELSYSNIIDDFNIHVLSGDTQSWPPTLSTLHCTYLCTIAHLRRRLVNSDPPILQSSAPLLLLVSASPVAWTEKKTETGLDAIECNQTAGCGCPDFGFFRLPVSQFGKYNKTARNWLTPVATGLFLYTLPSLPSLVSSLWAGGEVATKRRAQLGAARFEELQMMKFAWRNNIRSLAALNSLQVEEVDEIREYENMLVADRDFEEWDKPVDKYFVE